jgi:hypothetical protein
LGYDGPNSCVQSRRQHWHRRHSVHLFCQLLQHPSQTSFGQYSSSWRQHC